MASGIKIHNDEGIEVSDDYKSEIYDGIYSLKEWLEGRKKSGKLIDNEQDYQRAQERLDNMQVFLSDKGYACVLDALKKGELHFKENIVFQFGSEKKAYEALSAAVAKMSQGEKNIAFNARDYVKEPAIFVNVSNFEKNKGHLELRSLSSIVMHEATHAADLNFSENMAATIVNKEVNEGVAVDDYKDKGMEVYARLMQMRKDLALDADTEYSLDDVKKMREDCLKKRGEYDENKEDGKASPQDIDSMIFERYSDEQIRYLLNATSDIGEPTQNANGMSREELFGGMKRDFAANQAKGRVKGRLQKEKAPVEENSATGKEKAAQPAVNNGEIIRRMAEREYS